MRLSVRKAHVKEWITCIVITHMWQSWVEIISLCILSALPCSKLLYCNAKLPLRTRFIFAALMHRVFMHLHSASP